MEEKGIIRPSNSPWSAPIVIVQKKDGTARFCVDYRALNDKTRKDAYPIPRIEDNLDALEGSTWFSTLDLASGYWQVAVAEKDKPKTAFTTKFGLYEFNVLPFGLTNGPATFQRLMEQVLKGLQWRTLVLYLDDIVVFSSSLEEHLERLEAVFGRLREAGLKLKPRKCRFFQRQVNFLGHIIDEKGIHTDPEKVKQIQTWACPRNVHDVRVFLGLTSYYRRFVKDYAKKASPLYKLTKKDVEFIWSEEQEAAFQNLKQELAECTQLAYPKCGEGPFILDTDASGEAIGAVLSQIQEGKEQVLAFGSRCLSAAERNYCVTRKELLAVVYFMCYYKHYLLGSEVTVRSDHGSLRWLKEMKNPTGQVARWIERLAPFHWKIEHRAGKQHTNADAMSRKQCVGDCVQCLKMFPDIQEGMERERQLLAELGEVVLTVNRVNKATGPRKGRGQRKAEHRAERDEELIHEVRGIWDKEEIAQAVSRDPVLAKLLTWETKPRWEEIATESTEIKYYWQLWGTGRIAIRDGLLWFKWDVDGSQFQWKLVVPRSYQARVLEVLHDHPAAGHFGEVRSIALMRRVPVYWFKCYKAMRMHCRACDLCLRCKPQVKRPRAPMQSFTAGEPLERMAIDIKGELHQSRNGNSVILVAVDYFTKFVVLVPLPDQRAITVAKAMVNEVFTKIGIPRLLHSDRGTDFMSALFQETCNLLQIEKTATTPWRPQSDGMVERFNRTLGSMLRQHVDQTQDDWDELLPLCALAYNSSKHTSSGYTPNFLMFGRDFRVPLEYVLPTPDEDEWNWTTYKTVDHYVKRLAESLQQTYALTREALQRSVAVQKRYYNKKAKERKFAVGQSVWLYNPRRRRGRTPKLDIPWEGPYAIVRILGDVLYEIQASRRSKSKIVHVDKLAATKQTYDTSWVSALPQRKKEQEKAEEILTDLSKMFERAADRDEGVVNPIQEPEVLGEGVVEVDSDPVIPAEENVDGDETISSGGGAEVADPEPEAIDEPDVKVPKGDPTMQKTTRSGKQYYVGNQAREAAAPGLSTA